jgi:hypothetical protein
VQPCVKPEGDPEALKGGSIPFEKVKLTHHSTISPMHILNRTLYSLFTVLFALAVSACTQSPKDQQSEVAEEPQDTTTEAVNSEMATLNAMALESGQDDDVYLLGWTNEGKILAYRSFYLSDAISRHSTITVQIVNIVTDEVLWSFKRDWDEGNAGQEGTETSPATGAEAWTIVAEEVTSYTAAYNIVPGEEPESHESYGTFPFGGDIVAYSAGVTVSPKDNSYTVVASSSADGEKTLIQKQREPGDFSEVSVVGYFMNPQSDRIAIIVKESPPNPVIYYYVTGCSLKTGFKAVAN